MTGKMHSTSVFCFTVTVTGAINESCFNNRNFAAMQKHDISNKDPSNALHRPSGFEYSRIRSVIIVVRIRP